MKDLLRRLKQAEPEVAVTLIYRGAFRTLDLRSLSRALRGTTAVEPGNRGRVEVKEAAIRAAIGSWLTGRCDPGKCDAGFIPALASGDRQLAIHAVINGRLTDNELGHLEKLLALQRDGGLLRQLRIAVELEGERRRIGGFRSPRNRVAKKRG